MIYDVIYFIKYLIVLFYTLRVKVTFSLKQSEHVINVKLIIILRLFLGRYDFRINI